MDYLMAVPFPTSSFNSWPCHGFLLFRRGSCLMLQLSFCGPKCLQLNCAVVGWTKKNNSLDAPQKKMNECPPLKRKHFERTLRLNQKNKNFERDMLVFRGVYWSSVFSGLSRKKKVTSYYKKCIWLWGNLSSLQHIPKTFRSLGTIPPQQNGSSILYLEPKWPLFWLKKALFRGMGVSWVPGRYSLCQKKTSNCKFLNISLFILHDPGCGYL